MSCEGVRKSTCEGRTQFRFKRKIVSYIKGQGFVCLQNGIYNERQRICFLFQMYHKQRKEVLETEEHT